MHLEYLFMHKLCKNSHIYAYFRICDRILQHFCTFCPT